MNYLDDEDFIKFDDMAANAVLNKSLDTEFLGVKVGRIALYEFTLAHKKMSTDFNDLQWNDYHTYLINSLRTLQGFARYLDKVHPDTILTFSPQYSNINSAMQHAINKGIRVLFIENGTNLANRLGSMRLWDWKVHKLVNPALIYWGRSERNPVSLHSASMVVSHFSQLLSGQHFAVFSAPYIPGGDIRQRLNIKPNQKVIVMTLSSYDEAYAALLIDAFPYKKVFSDVFRTQAQWIKETIDWVKKRQDLFLVIRVHPRDFPNKREITRSEQSFMLEDLLKEEQANVHVNWPSEGISFYELLEDTDVILTGWSVTAMEALVLGIPVVTYDANLPSYPKDIQYTGHSKEEYFANIDRAIADGWCLQNSVNGFRWLGYNFASCTVTVSEKFGRFELASKSSLRRFLRRGWRFVKNRIPVIGYSWDLLHWRGAISDIHIVSAMLEYGYDALPPARKMFEKNSNTETNIGIDDHIVISSLASLYEILYGQRKSTKVKKTGLSFNIRSLLIREGLL
jgi:hypothetical protein